MIAPPRFGEGTGEGFLAARTPPLPLPLSPRKAGGKGLVIVPSSRDLVPHHDAKSARLRLPPSLRPAGAAEPLPPRAAGGVHQPCLAALSPRTRPARARDHRSRQRSGRPPKPGKDD